MKNYILFLFLIPLFSSGQITSFNEYSYSIPDSAQLIKDYKSKLKKELDSINKYKSDYKEIFSYRNRTLVNKIEENHFIQNEDVINYFDFILKEICNNNNELNYNEINLFISRYPIENAACYSEGTIIFNLGLYRKLESESQIALILAHELAHYYFRHGNKSITKKIETIRSKEYKKEVKEISKMEYNSRERIISLLKNFTYDNSKHSREHETESDSMGFVFLSNTRYNLQDAIKAVYLLDSINEDKYKTKIKYDSIFNFDSYPFKKRWLLEENESIFSKPAETKITADGFILDSLKTHPDCINRYALLKELVRDRENNGTVDLQGKSKIDQLKNEADFEFLYSHYANEDFGEALYYALNLTEKYPENLYLTNLIGNCFYQFYNFQKEHELGRHLESVSYRHKGSYKEFITMINNMRLTDYSEIGFHYMEKYKPLFDRNEDFYYQLILNSSIMEDKTSLGKYSEDYYTLFPKGKHEENIKSIINQTNKK